MGTIAEPVAGTISNGSPYSVVSGFWHRSLAPTAALVSVSGRVLTSNHRPVSGARVIMTDSTGVTSSGRTNSFGYYRIDNLEAGQTYIISVTAKGYVFAPQAVSMNDNMTDHDLIMQE